MTRSYFNGKADIWDKEIAENDLTRLEDMAQKLDIQPSSSVLDVGTGTGVFIPFLLKRVGDKGKLVCLDHAEKMLEKARQKNFRCDVEYICSDITATGFEDSVFDAVVCYSSFPHFRDKFQALKEISRILKKSGRLFICHTSSSSTINKIHQQIPELVTDLVPTREEMLLLLLSAGFEKVVIEEETNSYLAKAEKQ
jgi:ubiquinone/menaquinone biosynthesis C-methylase UbiE